MAGSAGFVKSPLSQMKLIEDIAELHCEVTGNPIPEVQWWFIEGEEPDETMTQLFDGARQDRVGINATYILHATSSIHLLNLTLNDTGTYECRASNDPDRNELKTAPKIKWIRSQANVIVFECECWEALCTARQHLPVERTARGPAPVPHLLLPCFTQTPLLSPH